MIRLFFRTVSINLLGIYLASQILNGVIVYVGGVSTLLMAALVIAVVNLFVRPVINLLLLPINLITLGMFRWVSNLVTLFMATRLIPNLQIRSFDFAGSNLYGIIIPPIHFSAFMAFVVATITITITFHFLYWLFQD
ncbi:MAG: phage holin family protein [Candidatus Amesbacteria bacterium]|nr:phage holin family protein [Candidatus Amesbacteria bacterium]